jgi:hypothetical protein
MTYDKLFDEFRRVSRANAMMAQLLETQGKALVADRELIKLLIRVLQANGLEIPDEAMPFLR